MVTPGLGIRGRWISEFQASLNYLVSKETLAEKYLNLFSEKSGIEKSNIQRWIPIVAAAQLADGNCDKELLNKWVDVIEYQ